MGEGRDLLEDESGRTRENLRLLVPREAWWSVFLRNLLELLYKRSLPVSTSESTPAAFWDDVFVERGLPWSRFLQSAVCHMLVLSAIWGASRFLALQPHIAVQAARFTHDDVVYYSPAEYLPTIDTRRLNSAAVAKADPEYAKQPIISVPPEADNPSQTIVTPPSIPLHDDVAQPNVVALLGKISGEARMPIGPAPAVPVSEISRVAPNMERSIIAPPPEVLDESRNTPSAPLAAVIAPPPNVRSDSRRPLGDLDIARSAVIAPSPQLALNEQRAFSGRPSNAVTRESARVIVPPPALGESGRSSSARSIIALGLRPAVGPPPAPPAGNRRGSFAATPEGRHAATGNAGSLTSETPGQTNAKASGSDSGTKNYGELPSGLYVGKPAANSSPVAGDPAHDDSSGYSVNPNLIANARPPRLTARSSSPDAESKLSQEERAVFGGRKFYSLSLTMPNLNSAGGSWIIRFAAIKPDPTAPRSFSDPPSGELSSPVATRKVDPAYPLELMRQNIGGTVILYAVIHADGTVGDVRVLRSIDERIDQYASAAIAKWKFDPATKNGAPVDVEATFWIPFRPTHAGSNF